MCTSAYITYNAYTYDTYKIGMGQSERSRLFRLHAEVLALRQYTRSELPVYPRHCRPQRPAGGILVRIITLFLLHLYIQYIHILQ